MRMVPFVSAALLCVVPAMAGPFHASRSIADPPRTALHIAQSPRAAFHLGDLAGGNTGWHRRRDDDAPTLSREAQPDPAPGGLSIGPVHADSEMVNGRRHMHYRVDGLSVAGGDISGSVSTHSAEVFLRWPTSN